MIVVSGTKRSGTSMWMQVLGASGVPRIGDAFPHNWAHTIAEANRGGFFESPLRKGIWWGTNPDPKSGAYIEAAPYAGHAIKIFATGLVRTERSYLDRVIVCVRHWREYANSLERLYALERESKARRLGVPVAPRTRIPPVLEWWDDNFRIVRDVALRRYPAVFVSYDAVLADPARVVSQVLGFVAPSADIDKGVAAVVPAERTQDRNQGVDNATLGRWSPTDAQAAVLDAWFETVHFEQPPSPALLGQMNVLQAELAPQIAAARRDAARAKRRERAECDSSTGSTPGGAQ